MKSCKDSVIQGVMSRIGRGLKGGSEPGRATLLARLAEHVAYDEAEATALAQIVEFVALNDRCFDRGLGEGHVTGSAWVLDSDGSHVLLTHHRKLGLWLQLGGHADGDADVAAVALREAREESGLSAVRLASDAIFDVDVHRIPGRRDAAEHLHYDVRYRVEAERDAALCVSVESHDLAWVELGRVEELTTDASVMRMVRKSLDERREGA